jgi:hypothetical protein
MDTSDATSRSMPGMVRLLQQLPPEHRPNWHPDEIGARQLAQDVEQIKRAGRGRDSTASSAERRRRQFVCHLPREGAARPAAVAAARDAGWNSQQAVNNIEALVDGLSLDLHTEVVDWLEMRDLQLAFFKAQVPHLDTPQDHAFFRRSLQLRAKHGSITS